ncbi:coiled-coil domain-containing protein 150-like [Rana temporaria]|uniref:coiled-coil domain-containing protein 150-like n=1 Tax=Rana temporaria TaxID=8407 RepID=UPI001AADCB7B|nr:coiled-coil domain-containing protein 150-like [Rana temporaria]XP_040205693.1 coiled-coil domain-containing protein 150-like [Rana temporaria]
MARPVIAPFSIRPTAPETFSVLEQRMRMAEEQTESLISDLRALGVNSQKIVSKEFEYEKNSEFLRPISPVRARQAFTGDGDTLWRNCENLVNRMCHMESMLQTLRLNLFRQHTDRELHTKHTGELEQRLRERQDEHASEMKDAQLEIMRLRQRLNSAIESMEREAEAKERLSAALEIATTTKKDVAMAAEEMKATKVRMSQRLAELQEKLSEEAALRALLEEEQADLLLTVEGLKNIVEEEQAQVQKLQKYCNTVEREGLERKNKLTQEKSRCEELEKENKQFQIELEAKDSLLSLLQEDVKITKQKLEAEQAELSQIKLDSATLHGAAEKVQSINQQLESQCSELTATVERLTNENIHLTTQHQQDLKVVQDTMSQKLQKQELMLNTVQESLNEELQTLQSHQTALERELETLRAEHTECHKRIALVKQKNAVQKERQDSTTARLRADLESALKGRVVLDSEKRVLQEELDRAQSDFLENKQNMEILLTENKLELSSVQASLLAHEQENRRLMDQLAVLEQEQNAKRQVEALLTELTDSKSKLAYEKGKLESRVRKLQSELQSVCDAQLENSKLRKLHDAVEMKYIQITSELDSCKIRLQRTEAKLRQTVNLSNRKEEDFTLAIQARDEAVREERKLREQIKTLEDKEENNRVILQQQLSDVCEERSRMSETLENILSSHTKLQKDLETLQTELGCRDADIVNLHKDRANSQKQIQRLEGELSDLKRRLRTAESQHHGKIEPLQRSIEIAWEDNRKLSHALDQAVQRNALLQHCVEELEERLQNREAQEKQLLLMKTQAEEEVRMKDQLLEERVTSLSKQHQLESKEAKKIARKEAAELKKALDNATAKSAELSRTNRELRARESMLQKEILQQKESICGLKTQLRCYMERKGTRKEAERIHELEARLKTMQKVQEDYERNNNEQCKRIQEFMPEVEKLRNEIAAAASCRAQEDTFQSPREKNVKSRMKLEERCGDIVEYNLAKHLHFHPQSTAEHSETKQKLKLISRNLLQKE